MNENLLIIDDVGTFSLYTIEKAYKISTIIGERVNILFLKFGEDKRSDEVKFIGCELKKINDIYNIDNFCGLNQLITSDST